MLIANQNKAWDTNHWTITFWVWIYEEDDSGILIEKLEDLTFWVSWILSIEAFTSF